MTTIGAQLRSQPAIHTYHNSQGASSVIDLVFTSTMADRLYEKCITSHDPDFDHGSDHYPILHRITLAIPRVNPPPRFNWEATDWARIIDSTKQNLRSWSPPQAHAQSINHAVHHLTTAIQEALHSHAAIHRPSPYTKRWWTKELTTLRKRLSHTRRQWRSTRTEDDHQTWTETRKAYQKLLTSQKREHWRKFLEDISDSNLFTATRYTTTAPTPRYIPPIRTTDNNLASTPEAQVKVFHTTFFAPPPPPDLSNINPTPTYRQLPLRALEPTELDRAIRGMAPNKAPGPDNIPVLVLQKVWHLICSPLTDICRTCLRAGYYPAQWRNATTLILRKPKRPDYSMPNAYRPIALLCTMGKLFEAVLAHRLSFLADRFKLLPHTHIGCRPGRSTEDGIIAIEEYTKHEWRKGNVIGALLVDVKNAFPSVSHPRLLHNLRDRRIPEPLVALTESFLTNRCTNIRCSDYTSDPLEATVGIPQGSPISGILYLFYNAPLLEISNDTTKITSYGWAEDIIYLAAQPQVAQVRTVLEQASVHALQWGARSASILNKVKTQYTYFTRNRNKLDDTPLRFGDALIMPDTKVTHLGTIFDRELCWRLHRDRAVNKAQAALMALSALARTTWGVPMKRFSQLVKTCVHPRSDYAALVWHNFGHNTQTTNKLDRTLRLAQRTALGAFRTTPGEALMYDSNMEPARTRLDRRVTVTAIRLLTLPDTNPATSFTRRALRRDVKTHRTALHTIFHSRTSFDFPTDLETIRPIPKPPWWLPNVSSHIATSKEEALEQMANLPHNPAITHLYSDGSKTEQGVGAGAVNLQHSRQLSLRLGDPMRATVLEAELAGIHLALQLATALPTTTTHVNIHLDNQRAIRACTERLTAQPGQYHILAIHTMLRSLQISHPQTHFHLNWIDTKPQRHHRKRDS